MRDRRLDDQLASVAALEEPLRRALFLYVGRQPGDVSRDQAARALRISRSLAAFHLDKLVAAGLLEASFRRLSGRSGPGAGRPSKLYRRSPRTIELSWPERHYEAAGRLLVRTLAEERAGTPLEALKRQAREHGERLGREARARAGATAGEVRTLARAIEVLREAGYEPRRDRSGGIVLANCPFDGLARVSRDVVCGMNLAIVEGLIAGLALAGVHARLEPAPGRCCVTLHPVPSRPADESAMDD